MRVLFLTHQYFPRHTGGTEMLVWGLAKRLQQDGHEAVIITYVESSSNVMSDFGFHCTEFDGVPVWELHYCLASAWYPAQAEYDNPLLAELVARAARELQPDVIHVAHAMKLSATVLPRLKQDGHRLIMSLSDFWPLCLRHTLLKPDGSLCETGPEHAQRCLTCVQATHGFAKPGKPVADEPALWAEARTAAAQESYADTLFRRDVLALSARRDKVREALLSADRLVALSSFQKQLLVQHGYPSNRLQVRHHGVETSPLEMVRASRAQVRSQRLVFVGTLAPHKGLHVLLEAMRQCPEVTLTLDVYGGDGPDVDYTQRLQELMAGDPRVTFHGVIAPERLGEALATASILVLPALWYENDPLVVKAALYCGMPVAASRMGSLAEQITEPETGWLLPPGDVAAWRDWFRRAAAEPVRALPPGVAVPDAQTFYSEMLAMYQEMTQ